MENYLITFIELESYQIVNELTTDLIKKSDNDEIEIERLSDLKKYVKGEWTQSETLLHHC